MTTAFAPEVENLLNDYLDLIKKHGRNSSEVKKFRAENEHQDGFGELAQVVDDLEAARTKEILVKRIVGAIWCFAAVLLVVLGGIAIQRGIEVSASNEKATTASKRAEEAEEQLRITASAIQKAYSDIENAQKQYEKLTKNLSAITTTAQNKDTLAEFRENARLGARSLKGASKHLLDVPIDLLNGSKWGPDGDTFPKD